MPLVYLPPARLIGVSDGDTVTLKMGVRLLGIDAPELHFPEGKDVALQDGVIEKLPKTAKWKSLPKELRNYLEPRLNKAGTKQKEWGLKAKAGLEEMTKAALTVKNKAKDEKGKRRSLFIAGGEEVFDRYGRILAYIGPFIPKEERAGSKKPPDTFNLMMLKHGFAVPYIHKTNIPKAEDLKLVSSAVQNARRRGLGFWKERDNTLHGYEFRALVRLFNGEESFRYPVLDLRTLGKDKAKVLEPFNYFHIPEEYRLFG